MAQGGRTESSGERVRRLLGTQDGEVRKAPTVQELEQVHQIRTKVLSEQASINDGLRAIILLHAPAALEEILRMGTGKDLKAGAAVRLDASKWILERTGAFTDGANGALAGRSLAELPLDQLEQVLTSALESTRQAQALKGEARRVESIDDVVPSSGTTPEQSDPPTL